MKYYVLDDNKNLIEALSKEDVYSILEQAIEDGDLSHIEEDSAFVSKLKEANNNNTVHIWLGTTAEFNAIQTKDPNTLYILADDDSADDWDAIAEQVETNKQDIEDLKNMPRLKKATFTSLKDLTLKLHSIMNGNESNLSNIVNVSFKFNSSLLSDERIELRATQSGNSILSSTEFTIFNANTTYNLKVMFYDSQAFWHFSTVRGGSSDSTNLNVIVGNNSNTVQAKALDVYYSSVLGFVFDYYTMSKSAPSGEFSVLYYE